MLRFPFNFMLSHVGCLQKFQSLRSRLIYRPNSVMKDSAFVQKFNPATGKLEWELQPEKYDYVQEVARAGFADMLHDEERVNLW